MTDPEFAVAIDFNALTKAQLLTMCGLLADKIDSTPVTFQKGIESGALTRRQANVLEVLRSAKGDAFVEQAALTTNLDAGAVTIAGQVKDWINTHKGADETAIRAAFPAMDDPMWTEIKRFLINTKQVRPAYSV